MNPDIQPPNPTPAPPPRPQPPSQPPLDQNQPPIAPSQPIQSMPTSPTAGNNKKRLGMRFWAIVTVAALLVLTAVGVAAYTVYSNSPDRVVGNAIRSLIVSETGIFNGTVDFEPRSSSEGPAGKVTANFSGQGNSTATQVDFDVTVNFAPMNLNFKGSAITANEPGDLYLKVEDSGQMLNSLFGDEVASMPEFGEFVQKVDDKWIHIPKEEQSDDDDDGVGCVMDVLDSTTGDDSELNELMRLYEDNRFVTVENELGTETIGDSTSRGFELGFDEQKAKEFGAAAETTSLGSKLTECVDKSGTDSQDDEDSPQITVKLWADQRTHSLTRLEVSSQGDDFGKLDVSVDFELDQPVEVNVPSENVTPIKDIEEELQSLALLLLFSGFSGQEFEFELDPTSTT